MKRLAFALLLFATSAGAEQLVTDGKHIAVIDGFANRIQIVDGNRTITTQSTPVDAAFAGSSLFVVERDSSSLARYDRDGRRTAISVAADPAFVRVAAGKVYVYSRVAGVVQEIDAASLKLLRSLKIEPFASDFELDGRSGYLAYPQEATLRTFSLPSMMRTGEVKTGAVPVDITLLKGASAVSAAKLAVADPASKRVWVVEGKQSAAEAFARGFVRGFLGLGLFRGRDAEFPTGVDRVASLNGRTYAWDSSSGTLYRVEKSKSSVVAKNLGSVAFAVTENGVAIWKNGHLEVIR